MLCYHDESASIKGVHMANPGRLKPSNSKSTLRDRDRVRRRGVAQRRGSDSTIWANVPIPDDAAEILSMSHGDFDVETFEVSFFSGLSRSDLEIFYKTKLAEKGYSVLGTPMIFPSGTFTIPGQSTPTVLVFCGQANQPTICVATRNRRLSREVSVTILLGPEESPCVKRASRERLSSLRQRLPNLTVPPETTLRNLDSSQNEREACQSALLTGETSIPEIVEALCTSIRDSGFEIVTREASAAMGLVEWSSLALRDSGVVSVVSLGRPSRHFKLTSRVRFRSQRSKRPSAASQR